MLKNLSFIHAIVMLEQRNHPLFAEFAPHFRDFMKHMKSQIPQSK